MSETSLNDTVYDPHLTPRPRYAPLLCAPLTISFIPTFNAISLSASGVIRAFTQTLNLINAAEVYHRLRLLRNADIVSGQVLPSLSNAAHINANIHNFCDFIFTPI